MIRATKIENRSTKPIDTVTLAYDERFRRRIKLIGDTGVEFLLDLTKTTDLRQGDDLVLEDDTHIRVRAADEPLVRIDGNNAHHLLRLTWHIGNRHLPCEIREEYLVIRADHVIEHMLEHLGARIQKFDGPFTPECGAYGQGRIHSHEH